MLSADNVIIMLTCRECWKRANYLVVELVGEHVPALQVPFPNFG